MKKFLLLILITIIFVGCSNEPPVSVTTEKVLAVKDSLTLTHEGIISPSNEIKIFSPISGNVMEKYIEDDADISERQMLFKVAGLGPHSDYLQAKKELAETMTAFSKALVENDSAALELQRKVQEKQALVQKLEEEAARGIIYAPKAGRLGEKVAPLGMPVNENETVLATIGNINPVAVKFETTDAETKLLAASPALKISLTLTDGKTYTGGRFKDGEIIFDNPNENLHFGATAQITIDGINIQNALLVPEKAIRQNGAENFVYIDKDGKAAVKKIRLGDKLGNYFIVEDGLTADDSIITNGFENLREGSPLNVNDK